LRPGFLSGFAIDRAPVTVAEFSRFTEETGYLKVPTPSGLFLVPFLAFAKGA
jgi:formylglycine-generating enzyme required for sulfatase activity